jgi:hypothetical protein
MNRRFALWGGSALSVALLFATVIVLSSNRALAQTEKPELPTLSLTGGLSNWNSTYYPDGRIWSARRGSNGNRTLLVPVFIKNCWRNTETYETFPIYSFKFKVQYDSTAVEFVGIEKNGPNYAQQNMPISCLAKDFEFSSHVARDTTYQSVIGAPIQNRLRGKRVMIDAVCAKPLPQTGDITSNCDQRPFVELVYLRFNVIANPEIDPVSSRTPLIITNDTLFYNDFQVGYELPFPNDPQPPVFAGLGGVDNYFLDANGIEQIRDPLRPSKPGMIWLEVTDLIPQLSFTNQADPQFRIVDSVAGHDWFIVEPITIDYGSNYDDNVNGIGTRDIDVINAVLGTRAYDITVQSDQPWLKFKSFLKGGQGEINPFPQPVREGYIRMMDKGILGTTLGQTPMADPTIAMRDLNMRVICDPAELPDGNSQEVCGIYVGYLTFKSASLNIAPVRIKVTFIYFRTPYEPNEFDDNNSWQEKREFQGNGIRLEVRNNADPIQRTYMVFGVGYRARDSCDTLFGETIYNSPLSGFGARWYPKQQNDPTGSDIYTDGLGDLWAATASRPKSASRDIRDIYSDTTILYWCRFSAGSPLNYPVVVSWDTDDFIPGSDLFIRDTLNGGRFNINMRQATNIGGSRYSMTIRDADVTAFVIEYTLPKVAEFPVINKGWNLLSLPVNPSSSYWKDVFKFSMTIPISFGQNTYQSNAVDVKPGVGYFVKYSDEVDKTIAGSRIFKIDDANFPTRLYDGWNTIGSLSTRTTVEKVTLLPYGTGQFPLKVGDIYRYVTDRGYQAVSEIVPGLGYWLKISGQAYLAMEAPRPKQSVNGFAGVREHVKSTSTHIVVSDVDQKRADLYVSENATVEAKAFFELPPVPPSGLFDVRFSNQSYIEDAASPVIRVQGTTYPITIKMNNPSKNYTVVDPVSGEVLGTILAGRSNAVTITDSKSGFIRLQGGEAEVAALSAQATPNPIATVGSINVNIPVSGNVLVEVYNEAGARVSVVANEVMSAGTHALEFNGAALSAGQYTIRVTNEGSTATSLLTIVR